MKQEGRRRVACSLCGDWFDPGDDGTRTQCPRCAHREGDPDEADLDFCRECGRDDHTTADHPLICPYCGEKHPYEQHVVEAKPRCNHCGEEHESDDCPELREYEEWKAAKLARGFPDPAYTAERPETWEEGAPSGLPWGVGLRRYRRYGAPSTSEESKAHEWERWQEEWDKWPYWTTCPDCGFEVPVQTHGTGWGGTCPRCGRSVWVTLSSEEVRNNPYLIEE